MFEVVDVNSSKWLSLWYKMPNGEIQAHPRYVQSFSVDGWEGRCALLEHIGGVVLYPFLLKDGEMRTPYGYGGPYFWGADKEELSLEFWYHLDRWQFANKIKKEFISFHLFEDEMLFYSGETDYNRDNYVVDLTKTEDDIWMSFEHKVRKNVKCAERVGVGVVEENTSEDFYRIYKDTLDRRSAEKVYSKDFIDNLCYNIGIENYRFFNAVQDGVVVSTELLLLSRDKGYSFLGGTDSRYYGSRPNEKLKWEMMKWMKKEGKRWYVLGGGKEKGDGIERYKKSFAPDGMMPYQIGTWESRRG